MAVVTSLRGAGVRALVSSLLATTLLGCGPKVDFPKGYDILAGNPAEVQLVGRSVLLIADNQRHYLYGQPVWIRTRVIDQVVTTAIRAPQLDLFAPAALEHALDTLPADAPIIHLGDGMDLSCVAEYEGFKRSMDTASADWFTAPGNHDGIYFGSTGREEAGDWAAACDGGGGKMDKAAYIYAYLTAVLAKRSADPTKHPQRDDGTLQFARQFASKNPTKDEWAYSGRSPKAWLTRVAWNIDQNQPHHSWILQELTATLPQQPDPSKAQRPVQHVKYVLLDTANYKHPTRLLPIPPHVNAGSTGDVDAEQLERLESWLGGYHDSAGSSGRAPTIVLFGHHPFNELTSRAQAAFEKLRSKYGLLTYVSAHTHHGTYYSHQTEHDGWVELNVGSVIDWPLEFREFRVVERPPLVGKHFYTSSQLYEISTEGEDAIDCDAAAWQPRIDDPDYYVDYTKTFKDANGTNKLIFDSLLQSYKRLLAHVPSVPGQPFPAALNATDDASLTARILEVAALPSDLASLDRKRNLLRALEAFDDARRLPPDPTGDPVEEQEKPGQARRARYRVCQAIWASKDDELGVRRARRENFYIGYPPRPPEPVKPSQEELRE